MSADEGSQIETARRAPPRTPGRPRWGPAGLAVVAVFGTLVAACSSAAAPKPSGTDATFNSAVAAEKNGDRALAVADFLAVVKADPRNTYAWYDLGVIADQVAQPAAAEADYRRSLGTDPGFVPALYNLAVIEAPDAPAVAAQLYERAVRAEPRDADAHLNLGLVLKTLGHTTVGDAQIATALRLDPSLSGRVAPDVTPGS
ncbi:MAG: tetratricopeptide repeat protein [Acidimicrobiales bacterium]|jgi:tetratricopeptide (TPR) repeat protein